MRLSMYIIVILLTVHAAFSQTANKTQPTRRDEKVDQQDSSGEITKLTKKKSKKGSTSSDSDRQESDQSADDSLGMHSSSDTSESDKKHTRKPNYIPKSSAERKGWRKWHRKCTTCPEDMRKKWKDFTIKWICGAYQRARRSFKSRCMMQYRNCQDGTMFVKFSNGRCKNETSKESVYHGEHFFYEYRVKLSYESSNSKSSSSSAESTDSSYTD